MLSTSAKAPSDRTRYLSTVDFATLMPSFPNSPTIRGVPHSELAAETLRMSSRISSLISGLTGFPDLLSRFQWSRKRLRCHAITVAGWTKTRTSRHVAQ
jgi:hypothetical protein